MHACLLCVFYMKFYRPAACLLHVLLLWVFILILGFGLKICLLMTLEAQAADQGLLSREEYYQFSAGSNLNRKNLWKF